MRPWRGSARGHRPRSGDPSGCRGRSGRRSSAARTRRRPRGPARGEPARAVAAGQGGVLGGQHVAVPQHCPGRPPDGQPQRGPARREILVGPWKAADSLRAGDIPACLTTEDEEAYWRKSPISARNGPGGRGQSRGSGDPRGSVPSSASPAPRTCRRRRRTSSQPRGPAQRCPGAGTTSRIASAGTIPGGARNADRPAVSPARTARQPLHAQRGRPVPGRSANGSSLPLRPRMLAGSAAQVGAGQERINCFAKSR